MSTRTGSNLKDGDTISTTYEPEGTSLTAKLPSVLRGEIAVVNGVTLTLAKRLMAC